MSISTIQNFFKETITRAVSLTGATNIYVSALPTPSEGYVVISPSSSSLREIVYYTAKGTDSNGTYLTVTLANRGLGGTTAQTHAIGEPVRMNVTAEHIKEISDALDQIVAEGAQDASTTTKGISKLSVAPVSATNPIAVGDNDPRLNGYGISDGSDGDVVIASGTTTLTRDMFYNNLTVNGSGVLNTAGWRVFVKGTLTVDKTSGAYIHNNGGNGGNASGQTGGSAGAATAAGTLPASKAGKTGGNGGNNAVGNGGDAGFNETYAIVYQNGAAGGASGGVAGGAGGTVSSPLSALPRNLIAAYNLIDYPTETTLQKMHISAGAGSGAAGTGSPNGAGGGGGGSGAGGGVVFLATKILQITGSEAIQAKGGNGGNGGDGHLTGLGVGNGGGGAGGNGGVILAIYAQKIGSGTMSVAGGAAGAAGVGGWGSSGQPGNAGADGLVIEITN